MSLVFVGTYTDTGSEGIYTYELEMVTGALQPVAVTPNRENPSYLVIHPNGRYLYAANEMAAGSVTAYVIHSRKSRMTQLNQVSTQGHSPCYLCIDPTGSHLLVTNYMSGNVTVLPIGADGRLGEATAVVQHHGSGSNPERQEAPHPHSVELDPTGEQAWVMDLGLDQLLPYHLDGDNLVALGGVVRSPAGAGPRHLAWHPDRPLVYVINELNSTISILAYHESTGALTLLETVSTLPASYQGDNTAADIHLHPSGRFLYASNRGHDSIAIYQVEQQSGLLTLVGHQPTTGRTPRNFALDPTGQFLLVANQDGNDLVSFRIDALTGSLSPTGQVTAVPKPVCVKFLP